MDTLFNLPVMDIIAGFIILLITSFVIVAIIAWKQCRRANWLAAELNGRIIRQEIDDRHMRSMVAYIKTFRSTWQEPGFPSDEFTLNWMKAQGIEKYDAPAMIYKYLSKALSPDEHN